MTEKPESKLEQPTNQSRRRKWQNLAGVHTTAGGDRDEKERRVYRRTLVPNNEPLPQTINSFDLAQKFGCN